MDGFSPKYTGIGLFIWKVGRAWLIALDLKSSNVKSVLGSNFNIAN